MFIVNPLSSSRFFDPTLIKETTLDQFIGRLPIGVQFEGEWLNDYKFKPYLVKHHLLLGSLEDENVNNPKRLSRIYSDFLSKILDSIGDYPFSQILQKLNLPAAKFFSQMYSDDIVTMILSMRFVALGEKLTLNTSCPFCEKKIFPDVETEYHDLTSLKIGYCDRITAPPVLDFQNDGLHLLIEPLRWGNVSGGEYFPEGIPYETARLCASAYFADTFEPFTYEGNYLDLDHRSIRRLEQYPSQFTFGAERDIDMDCPHCLSQWKSLLLQGKNHESFYCSLLSPPRASNEPGAVEKYINEVSFFLMVGEQAPKINPLNLTPSAMDYWVKKLSDVYKKQEEERKKAESKSKARRRK